MARKVELFVPVITPFKADLTPDHPRFTAHAKAMLAAGAHGIAPFGTTGEAASLTLSERMAGLEALLAAGIPPQALIPGTGCCALGDTVALSAHATSLGCRGVLMLPPFFYKPVSEDGVFAAYAQVIEAVGAVGAVGAANLRVYLYHIPQLSGVAITLPLVERLLTAFPGAIAGLKDSSGNWENTKALIAAFGQIDIYSASESLIPRNAAAGGAGCISASANVNPAGIRRLIDGLGSAGEADLLDQASQLRSRFESLPLIPAIKAAVALQTSDPAFARLRPPLVKAGPEHAAAIASAVAMAGSQAPR